MTPSDDDVLARLRLSLHTIADRTPVSSGRSTTLAALAEQPPSRSLVTAFSAAAAVAAMVAVATVVANAHSGGHGSVHPGAGGLDGAPAGVASSAAPSVSAVASVAPTPPSSPTPVTSAIAGSVAPQHSPAPCVPENYYVVASSAEVAGLTYMLPATPAGYVLYGGWGTISRNLCADSVTWYTEYWPVSGSPDSSGGIQVRVTKVGGDSVAGDLASASPVASTPITVNGTQGFVLNKGGSYATIGWTTGGAQIALSGPLSNGDVSSLAQVADSLVLLSPSDPRIVAPADCQVPPGGVCSSASPTPTSSASSSGSLVPTPTPTG